MQRADTRAKHTSSAVSCTLLAYTIPSVLRLHLDRALKLVGLWMNLAMASCKAVSRTPDEH